MVNLISDKLKRISRELEHIKIDIENHLDKDISVSHLDSVIDKLHKIRQNIT